MDSTTVQHDPERALHELNQIASAMSALNTVLLPLLESIKGRHEELLEEITRPTMLRAEELRNGNSFEYHGAIYKDRTAIAVHVTLLRRLWTDFPECQNSMHLAVRACGRDRTYVANSPEALFPGKSVRWMRGHYRTLVPGWVVDTNLSNEQKLKVLRAAVCAAGLAWGTDVNTSLL